TTNGGTAITGPFNTQKVFNANFGEGTIYLDGTNGSSDFVVATAPPTLATAELSSTTGTDLNTAGTDFSTVTTGAAALSISSNSANGKHIVFKFNMADYAFLDVSYATSRQSAGF